MVVRLLHVWLWFIFKSRTFSHKYWSTSHLHIYPGGYIINIFREEILTSVDEYRDRLEPLMASLEVAGKWRRLRRDIYPEYQVDRVGVINVHQVCWRHQCAPNMLTSSKLSLIVIIWDICWSWIYGKRDTEVDTVRGLLHRQREHLSPSRSATILDTSDLIMFMMHSGIVSTDE